MLENVMLFINNDASSFILIKIYKMLSRNGNIKLIIVKGSIINDTYGTKKILYTTDKKFT